MRNHGNRIANYRPHDVYVIKMRQSKINVILVGKCLISDNYAVVLITGTQQFVAISEGK